MSDKEYWRGYDAARLQNAAAMNALRQRAEQAEARVAKLEGALRELIPANCDALHHAKRDQHPVGTSCPVVARALAALSAPGQPEGER
jgi:hypothetical protein